MQIKCATNFLHQTVKYFLLFSRLTLTTILPKYPICSIESMSPRSSDCASWQCWSPWSPGVNARWWVWAKYLPHRLLLIAPPSPPLPLTLTREVCRSWALRWPGLHCTGTVTFVFSAVAILWLGFMKNHRDPSKLWLRLNTVNLPNGMTFNKTSPPRPFVPAHSEWGCGSCGGETVLVPCASQWTWRLQAPVTQF